MHRCAPIKLDLQIQAGGQIWPEGCKLLPLFWNIKLKLSHQALGCAQETHRPLPWFQRVPFKCGAILSTVLIGSVHCLSQGSVWPPERESGGRRRLWRLWPKWSLALGESQRAVSQSWRKMGETIEINAWLPKCWKTLWVKPLDQKQKMILSAWEGRIDGPGKSQWAPAAKWIWWGCSSKRRAQPGHNLEMWR